MPRQILVPTMPSDLEAVVGLPDGAAGRAGGASGCRYGAPRRPCSRPCERNAGEAFVRHRLQRTSDHNSRARALEALQRELRLPDAPLRIECYDMSHLQGTDYVGSMVVLRRTAQKSDYRHFKVATVAGNDDYAAMEEVLTRRLTALLEEEARPRPADPRGETADAGPGPRRAGTGGRAATWRRWRRGGGASPIHRNCCSSTEASASSTWPPGCSNGSAWASRIPVASLAKSFEEVYLPDSSAPVRLPRESEALYLLQRLRDEAHRLATPTTGP